MQIGAYTIVINTADHTLTSVEDILRKHFCVLFVAHTGTRSFAVCEDIMYTNNGHTTYRNYEDYSRSSLVESSSVTIQETESSETSFKLIKKVLEQLHNHENVIIHWNVM
ncbi:hypothetical protein KM620_gp113 [Hyposidra talaca nucleopolyhedrovirus]|uniref:Uncharacterized protein n=1 Tax=Hyposidra talaca nucleopolyhedrovirus TaxID=1070315 RepID=A0A2Z4HI73_9ABAC|nr:hypothetical protein KM620_gp113 [Hyposidra talaca nucleopolyhedrovirus]AWW14473.1 hypothetical protein HytaNPV_gp113 [Hyposidra talaca nucleopolyhedrovirus]